MKKNNFPEGTNWIEINGLYKPMIDCITVIEEGGKEVDYAYYLDDGKVRRTSREVHSGVGFNGEDYCYPDPWEEGEIVCDGEVLRNEVPRLTKYEIGDTIGYEEDDHEYISQITGVHIDTIGDKLHISYVLSEKEYDPVEDCHVNKVLSENEIKGRVRIIYE